MPVERRFLVLRLIGTLIKVGAVLMMALGSFLGVMAMVSGSQASQSAASPFPPFPIPFNVSLAGSIGGALIMLSSLFYGMLLYAFGEVIYLFLAIEENTRATNLMMGASYRQPEQREIIP